MTQRVAKKKLREARSNQKTTMVSEKLDKDSFGQERYSGCVWACLPSPLLGAALLELGQIQCVHWASTTLSHKGEFGRR